MHHSTERLLTRAPSAGRSIFRIQRRNECFQVFIQFRQGEVVVSQQIPNFEQRLFVRSVRARIKTLVYERVALVLYFVLVKDT